MPAANRGLDDPDAGEGVDGPRAALRFGLWRVPERAPLVPPPREELRDGQPRLRRLVRGARKGKKIRGGGTHTAVLADGEGVAAAGDDGGDGVGLQRGDGVGPVLLLAVAHAQLPVLPGPPAQTAGEKATSISGAPTSQQQ
jgi:hypothetical protein